MANIQEDITRQVWDLFLKFFGTGSEFVYQIAHEGNVALKQGFNFTNEFLLSLINKQKEAGQPTDITAQMLKRNEKGETINTMSVADEDAAALKKLLEEKGVLINIVDNLNDDSKYFMYMSNDAQKVIDGVTLFQAEKGLITELKPEMFLENYAKDGVGTISGLDRIDLEVFRNYAKENSLVFASVATDEQGKHLVIYDPKDIETVKKTMDSTLWALSGKEGRLFRKQMAAHLANKQGINRSLVEPEKEYYVVNANDVENYVHLTANDLTYYKKSKEIMSIGRNDHEFMEKGVRVFEGMLQPVLLTREEFERFIEQGGLKKEELQKNVLEKSKDLPKPDFLKEEQRKQNERLERIQSKMALDDENTAGFWIYDDSISFASGGTYEEIEDIDEQTKEDIADARENATQYKFSQFENRDIEYLIAEAEKRRTAPKKEEKQPEREI